MYHLSTWAFRGIHITDFIRVGWMAGALIALGCKGSKATIAHSFLLGFSVQVSEPSGLGFRV